ncbi:MAG: TRAP transporter small permease [Chloroflexota bacterium]
MGAVRFTLSYFEEMVAGTFMVLMCLATFANVVARYFFNMPIEWAEEFSRYAFIWLVFMGAALSTKHKKHIIIDTVITVVPQRVRSVLQLVSDTASMVLMLVLVYYGWVLITYATQPTATLKVPQYVVYLVVPISAALIIVHSLGDMRRNFLALIRGGERP